MPRAARFTGSTISLAAAWSSPLIVEGHVYIADEDGDVCVFELSAEKHEPLSEINMGSSVYSTPTVAHGVLFIASRTHLFAIQTTAPSARFSMSETRSRYRQLRARSPRDCRDD